MSARLQPRPPTLRPMQVSSLERVLALEQACYEFPWTRGNFIDSLAAGYLAHCLVDADGALAGYRIAMPGVEEMHLLNITVAPDRQGQGLARTMLEDLVRLSRERGAATLWLEVRPSNPRARRIYERFGFRQVGLRKGYYPAANAQREDALVMSLDVARHGHDLD